MQNLQLFYSIFTRNTSIFAPLPWSFIAKKKESGGILAQWKTKNYQFRLIGAKLQTCALQLYHTDIGRLIDELFSANEHSLCLTVRQIRMKKQKKKQNKYWLMILLPIGNMYICGVYQTAKQNIVPFLQTSLTAALMILEIWKQLHWKRRSKKS